MDNSVDPDRDWHDCVVVARRILATNVVAFEFQAAAGDQLPSWAPGAHIDVEIPGLGPRQYSLCGSPADRDRWHIAVLREPAGRGGSAHLHDVLDTQQTIRVRGPRHHFALASARRHFFIAGGIGITPILPMVAELAATSTEWSLAYGGRSLDSMAFLDQLAEYGDRVSLYPEADVGLVPVRDLVAEQPAGTVVYACGPPGLLDATEEACRASSLEFHKEAFENTAALTAETDEPFDVILDSDGSVHHVPADRSILAVLEDAGVPVLESCREGTCGSCETGVLEGVIDHRDAVLSESERGAGDTMMICVSRCRSRCLRLDL